jgi:hypothetical protein
MTGWETVLAAVGGLLAGLGVGIALGRRGERELQRRLHEHAAQLRRSVIPFLEERAATLGLPESERHRHVDDPLELVVRLSVSVRATSERASLPFTDTIESPGLFTPTDPDRTKR